MRILFNRPTASALALAFALLLGACGAIGEDIKAVASGSAAAIARSFAAETLTGVLEADGVDMARARAPAQAYCGRFDAAERLRLRAAFAGMLVIDCDRLPTVVVAPPAEPGSLQAAAIDQLESSAVELLAAALDGRPGVVAKLARALEPYCGTFTADQRRRIRAALDEVYTVDCGRVRGWR